MKCVPFSFFSFSFFLCAIVHGYLCGEAFHALVSFFSFFLHPFTQQQPFTLPFPPISSHPPLPSTFPPCAPSLPTWSSPSSPYALIFPPTPLFLTPGISALAAADVVVLGPPLGTQQRRNAALLSVDRCRSSNKCHEAHK
jgi:hypothetical protein